MLIFAAIAGLFVTAVALKAPTLTIAGLLGLGGVLAIKGRWYLLPAVVMFLAATTLPAQVPGALALGGFSFRLYEPVLFAAFIWAVSHASAIGKTAVVSIGALAFMTGLGCVLAVINAADPVRIIGDVRYVIETVMAVVVGAVVVRSVSALDALIRTTRVSMWISAVFTLLASAGVVALSGRTEDAALGDSGGADAATRILAPATFFALAVVCICIAAATIGVMSMAHTWTWWAPAILVLFLAFSRNHLVAVVVTLLLALIAVRSVAQGARAVYTSISVGLVVVAVALLSPFLVDLPGGAWFGSQVDSYSSRVIDGFDSSVTSTDSSTVYRETEISRLSRSVTQSPVVGHGYGYAYQDPQGQPGSFFYERAPYYAHNFYWWTLAKTGIAGMVLFGVAVLVPLIRGFANRSLGGWAPVLAATLGGQLVICWVAPMPIATPTSAVFGAILGATAGLAAARRPATRVRTSFPESQAPSAVSATPH